MFERTRLAQQTVEQPFLRAKVRNFPGNSTVESVKHALFNRLLGRRMTCVMARYRIASSFALTTRELRVRGGWALRNIGSWYECSAFLPGRPERWHLQRLAQLRRIADVGFDVLYFPPIHPIGESWRKERIQP